MKALMKTARGVGQLTIREVDNPRPGRDEVLVRVAAAAVSGSDLAIEEDRRPVDPPRILGRDFAGTVEALGEEVEGWQPGDRVVPEAGARVCGACAACRLGEHHLCERKKVFGLKVDGGFAGLVRVPAWSLHRVPDNVSLEEAALAGGAAVIHHALVDRARVVPGDEVLVLGAGALGLIALQTALQAGARRVFVAELEEPRRELARSLGGTVLDAVRMDPAAEVIRFTGGQGADVVVECTGAPPAIGAGLGAVRRLGTFVAVGLTGRDEVAVPWDQLVLRSVSIQFSLSSTYQTWERVLEAMADGRLDLARLITHRHPLTRWQQAFESVRTGEAITCLLLPNASGT